MCEYLEGRLQHDSDNAVYARNPISTVCVISTCLVWVVPGRHDIISILIPCQSLVVCAHLCLWVLPGVAKSQRCGYHDE